MLSVFLTLIGLGALVILPVAQYPEIVPPTVQVTTSYPGASAEVVSQTVATPLEQEINGVENMLYMSSQSTGDGKLTITVTFRIGTDLNVAQMLTQNRVQDALPRLPEDVQRLGVQVRKATPNILLAVHLYSPDGSRDLLYLSNYATLHVKDALARLPGVGDVQLFGARDYAMRIWLDPDKVAAYNLNASEVLAALRAQNVQVSAGILNQPPVAGNAAYQLNVADARPAVHAGAVRRHHRQDRQRRGASTRIRDVGRVEIGAADYGSTAYMDRSDGLPLLIFAQPGANSLAGGARSARHDAEPEARTFRRASPTSSSTIRRSSSAKSVHEVVTTIFVAILLVVGVVFLFLQTWRASIIPVIAIPVSLVGTFTVLLRARHIAEQPVAVRPGAGGRHRRRRRDRRGRECRAQHRARACTPKEAAHRTMDEVGGALVSIALTLCAVFVPSAFLSGISGQFFRQFAVTIAASTVISCFVSLTLSPALCALLLKPHDPHRAPRARVWPDGCCAARFGRFNRGFEWLSDALWRADAPPGARRWRSCVVVYVALIGVAGVAVRPHADRLHSGAGPGLPDHRPAACRPAPAWSGPRQVVKRAIDIILKTPGVEHVAPFAGLDATTFTVASNAGTIFSGLPSLYNHQLQGVTANSVLADLRKRLSVIQDAYVLTIPPPPVQGIGNSGGFKMMLEDRAGLGTQALVKAAQCAGRRGQQGPELRRRVHAAQRRVAVGLCRYRPR